MKGILKGKNAINKLIDMKLNEQINDEEYKEKRAKLTEDKDKIEKLLDEAHNKTDN